MFNIIDTVFLSEPLFKNHPEIALRYEEGLLVLLAPQQTKNIDSPLGKTAMLILGDGRKIERKIDDVDIRHGVMALFFKAMGREEVKSGCTVTW